MRIFYIVAALMIFIASVSCNKAEDAPVAIDFDVQYDVELKAGDITTDNISSFGVLAAVDHAGKGFRSADADLRDFMNNVPVEPDDDGVWKANPPHYWPVDPTKTVSFFAYAPYGRGVSATGNWDDRSMTVTCVPDPDPAKHVDLCVAAPVLDRAGYDPVSFTFYHTMSRMSFAANYIGDLPKNNGTPICYLRIDEVSLLNIYGSGSVTVTPDPPYFSWADFNEDSPKNARYDLSVGNLTLGDIAIPLKTDENTYQEFVTAGGFVYLLPQLINPSGASTKTMMDVTFSYVKTDAQSTLIAQFQIRKDLPANVLLEPNTRYKVEFTIDVTNATMADVRCVPVGWINDWQNSENQHEDQIIK